MCVLALIHAIKLKRKRLRGTITLALSTCGAEFHLRRHVWVVLRGYWVANELAKNQTSTS